jgi:hypothetical protein
MGDDGGIISRATSKSTAVTLLGFQIANNGTFREVANGKNIADSQGGLLSAVNKLTSVHAFGSDEELGLLAVVISVLELYAGKRGTTARVVDDLLKKMAK